MAVNNVSISEQIVSEMDGKYLTFWTGGQLFAVPISDVVQIVQLQPITPIPEFPPYAKGIIDLRGAAIPVVDARLRLNMNAVAYTDRTCIIVASIHDRLSGLLVDGVEEVTSIADADISPPPILSGEGHSFLTGIAQSERRVVLLLNTERIFSGEELQVLSDRIIN